MSDCNERPEISTAIVNALIQQQFPHWHHLPIQQVLPGGWDNRTFRLGHDKLVRLPSAQAYVAQVEKEQYWLPRLQASLNLQIPQPIALGKPCALYPFPWSIYNWINGETMARCADNNLDKTILAQQLADFLCCLQAIEVTANAPAPGEHNFYRGGSLTTYHDQVMQALNRLKNTINTQRAAEIWQAALATSWQQKPVWLHGDISIGNLLLSKSQLLAVIDFGCMAVGDPACDLAIAWTFFEQNSRDIFKAALDLDEDTWLRGMAWALWKAVIVCAGVIPTPEIEQQQSRLTLNRILDNDN